MIRYWDYPTSVSNYWSTSGATTSATNATSSTRFYSASGTNSFTSFTNNVYVTVTRQYVVTVPEHWTREDCADLTLLINDETKTGFKITMWMEGDIDITDPSVEKRALEDFIPLLLSHAGHEDQLKIRSFFSAHPLSPSSTK
ncbi:hypothetical protein [Agrobacterium pusense]|uniref:hypothetical protein n=1 Tax=Agrobacterium pusense TaxID=648995 RepID=UPI0013004A00|nr:hypothetical protein [Agrobacterium pusense]